MFTLPFFSLLLCNILSSSESTNFLDLKQDEFMWGVATAAYQIEGATREDGRGASIWDDFSKVANSENADVADLSYYKYLDDIQLMKSLGVKYYRFSMSWSRIYPKGNGAINAAGVLHYNALIDSLVAAGIAPVVTLYHWDLPRGLQDQYRGWLGGQIVDDFLAYADTCFALFGDRVKIWITLNEPWTFIVNGYVSGIFAPGRCSNRTQCHEGDSAVEGYQVAHNALKAHAAVVDLYRREYAGKEQGQGQEGRGVIGITLNIDWAYPLDSSSEQDMAAAERRNEFTFSWFADPIYFGRYPLSMRTGAGERLPHFTAEESVQLTGSTDFIGLNHYSSWYLSDSENVGDSDGKGWFGDQHVTASKFNKSGVLIGPQGGSVWLNQVPQGMFETLRWVSSRYGRPVILITENGCDMLGEDEPRSFDESLFSFHEHEEGASARGIGEGGSGDDSTEDYPKQSLESMLHSESEATKSLLMDDFRVQYFTSYLHEVQRAMASGVDVRGYFAWSLLDNFEWADGFSKRFGLFRVNFSDPERHRSPKSSAFFYRDYIRRHSLQKQKAEEGKQDLRRNWRRQEQRSDNDDGGDDLFSYLHRASDYLFQNATRLLRLSHSLFIP